MATNRINPSRNEYDNQYRAKYGYVIRVPKLPDAHESIVDFVVYNEADNCFYKCVEVLNEEQHYFTWKAVTFGASRAFLVPVGKLTASDINYSSDGWTEKQCVDAVAHTINELAFCMRRYRETHFTPIGYTQLTSGKYLQDVSYYKWTWNDTKDTIGLEQVLTTKDGTTVIDWKLATHKTYVGEFTEMVPGVDYNVGDNIDDNTYIDDEIEWNESTMRDMVDKINEYVEKLNDHEAGITLAKYSDTLDTICAIVNDIIDEVNPFSIPWQLLLNRQNYLEKEVGAVTLQTDISYAEYIKRVDLAKWFTHEWKNYDGEATLLYGTVVQAIDSALNLIKFQDALTGTIVDLNDFDSLEDEGYESTFVGWCNRLSSAVSNLIINVVNHGKSLDQIWKALGFGSVGFVKCTSEVFEPDLIYYFWDRKHKFFDVIPATDYAPGETEIELWADRNMKEDEDGSKYRPQVYTFVDSQIARNLIDTNAANIAINAESIRRNKQLVDETLGVAVKRIFVEKLDALKEGQAVYFFSRDELYKDEPDYPFIQIELDEEDTLATLQERYGSIFVLSERNEYVLTTDKVAQAGVQYYRLYLGEGFPLEVAVGDDLDAVRESIGDIYVEKQTATLQIRINNEEIARLAKFSAKIDKRVNRLKQLTGVNGPDDIVEQWEVDGYLKLELPGTYHEYRKYYTCEDETADPMKFIELISGTPSEYENDAQKHVLTNDEVFQEGTNYFIREWSDVFNQYVYTLDTSVEIGAVVKPNTYYVLRTVDYVLPYYALTEDLRFVTDKVYYVKDIKGNYIPQEVQVGTEIPAATYFEYHNPTPRPAGVWIRKARKEHGGYEENNTHRGMIDRNTRDIEEMRQEAGAYQKWTKDQLKALEDFILSLMMSTLDIITQERSTLSLLHETVGKFIAIHNALERLEGTQSYKIADGIYDSGYDYYIKGERKQSSDEGVEPAVWTGRGFFLTEDTVATAGKTYYTRTGYGTTARPYLYTEVVYDEDTPIEEWEDLYEYQEGWRKLRPGIDYEVGLEVSPDVYTKDLVIATTENYTINDIRLAVNRVLRYHLDNKELPVYTEIPDTTIILETMTYYRYVDDEWEEIIPERDDPEMIGKRVRDYDSVNKWFIKTGEEIPDGSDGNHYSETPIRIFLNELIKLHRRPTTGYTIKQQTDNIIAGLGSAPRSSTFGIV